MPKRTNWFQDLIARIEECLAPLNAKVTQSKLLIDSHTGKEREIDIYIEYDQGNGRMVCVAVHCRDHGRKADTTWVEQVYGMQEALPIDKSILVSRSGFYKTALVKAEALKMDVMSYEDAKRAEWANFFINKFLITGSRIKPLRVAVRALNNSEEVKQIFSESKNLRELIVNYADGRGTSLASIVEAQVQDEKIHNEMKAKYTSGQQVTIHFKLPEGTMISGIPVSGLDILTEFTIESSEVQLNSSVYQDAQITHGETKLIGNSLKVIASELKGKNPMIEIQIDPLIQ